MSIITVGETLYDIIFRNGRPVAGIPGGAMLNSAVSLSRTGLDVSLVSELGNDMLGRVIRQFLDSNGVNTDFLDVCDTVKTPLSIAMLDEHQNASYSFYKEYPEQRLSKPFPETGEMDIILFGSFYSLDQAVRKKLVPWIRKSRETGAVILYDPNIRENHMEEVRAKMDLVRENCSFAHVVRGSDEDFLNLFGISEPDFVYKEVFPAGEGHLIITRNKNGVDLFGPGIERHYETQVIETLSTIGAGDAFNAGLVFGLKQMLDAGSQLAHLGCDEWDVIIRTGISFATDTCRSFENYISLELAGIYRKLVDLSGTCA